MAHISQAIPTLTGGISQQPDSLKRRSQCKDLENAWPSLVEGLMKRPPLEHHGYLDYSPGGGVTGISSNWQAADDPAIHWIDRDATERYMVGVNSVDDQGGRMRIAKLVTNPTSGKLDEVGVQLSKSAYDYLSSSSADSYRFQTIADTTFVVNRDKTVLMKSKKKDRPAHLALIDVKQSLGSDDENVVVTFNGNSTTGINGADAGALASNILAALNGSDTSIGTATWDYNGSRISMSSAHIDTILTHGKSPAIKISSSGAYPYVRAIRYNASTGKTSTETYQLTAESRLYAVQIDAATDTFRLSESPNGGFIRLMSNAHGTLTVHTVGTGSPPSGFDACVATRRSNLVAISHKDGTDFSLTVTDDHGGAITEVYHKTASTFAELPASAIPGMVLDITGDPSQGFDDYTVEFIGDEGEVGRIVPGHWVEVAHHDVEYEIDARTMPHILVRKSDGSFQCTEAGRIHGSCVVKSGVNDELKVSLAGHTLYPATDFYVLAFANGDRVTIDSSSASCKLAAGEEYYVKAGTSTGAAGYQYIELYADYDGSSTFTNQVTGLGASDTVVITKDNSYLTWDDRLAGDELTNPKPSFIDAKINDVAYYQNRLVLLSGENAVCSEAGQFSNFWRTTVLTLLDSAPVDVASSYSAIQILDRATAFGDQLYCGAEKVQLMLGAPDGQPFTPKTAVFSIATALSVSPKTQPVLMGSTMFVPFLRGDFAGLYEYIPDPQVERRYGHQDVTEHVPALIAGEIKALAALEREGVLVALSSEDSTLYVYKTYRTSQQVIQAAWGKFTFHDLDIRSISFYDHELYVMGIRQGKWYIEKMGFKAGRKDTGSSFMTCLDRRVRVDNDGGAGAGSAAYTASSNTTKFTLPTGYFLHGDDPVDVITTDGDRIAVASIEAVEAPASVTVSGDYSDKDVWIGQKYTMTFEFADQYMREQSGRGQSIIAQGRLQVRRGTIIFDNSNYFKVTVTPLNRESYSYPYTGMVLGGGVLKVGSLPLESGKFEFPVNSKNDEVTITVTNDSPLPSNLVGAEFESGFSIRSRRAQ